MSQALVSSLHESGVEPTVLLQQGGSLGTGGGSPATDCRWSCRLRTGAVAVHAAGDTSAEHELGDSVLGSALVAARVASIEPGASGWLQSACMHLLAHMTCAWLRAAQAACRVQRSAETDWAVPSAAASFTGGHGHLGLGVDLHWREAGAPPPGAPLESLWAAAGRDPGASAAGCLHLCMETVAVTAGWHKAHGVAQAHGVARAAMPMGLPSRACFLSPAPHPALLTNLLYHPAGSQPGLAALWQQLSVAAALLTSVRLGSPALLTLDRGTLAAATSLADGLLQLSPAPAPTEPATPAALQVECEVRCSLAGPRGATLATLAARSVHAVAGSSLGGLAGSSGAAVAVGSAELTRPQGGPDGQRLLAHAAGQQQADGQRLPAVQLLVVLR